MSGMKCKHFLICLSTNMGRSLDASYCIQVWFHKIMTHSTMYVKYRTKKKKKKQFNCSIVMTNIHYVFFFFYDVGETTFTKWKSLCSIDSRTESSDISQPSWHFQIHKMWHLLLQMHYTGCKSSKRKTVQCHFSRRKAMVYNREIKIVILSPWHLNHFSIAVFHVLIYLCGWTTRNQL